MFPWEAPTWRSSRGCFRTCATIVRPPTLDDLFLTLAKEEVPQGARTNTLRWSTSRAGRWHLRHLRVLRLNRHTALVPSIAEPVVLPGALAFAFVGLYFTATLPSMDHMGLPFFLVIMPIGFASGTYFPLPAIRWLHSLR